jgi:asparagine synthase (glutamine-hydrolysing)
MANSLEVRLPLIDHKVVGLVIEQKLKNRFYPLGKKRFLRNLVAEQLDSRLFNRPKSGFVLPIEQWCRQSLKREISETFSDRAHLASFFSRFSWTILVAYLVNLYSLLVVRSLSS